MINDIGSCAGVAYSVLNEWKIKFYFIYVYPG